MQRSSVFFFFPRPTTVCWQHALLATAFSRIWKPSDRWGSNDIEASGLCFVRRSSNEGWYIELRDSEEITEQVNVSTTTWLHCYARRTALFTDSWIFGGPGCLLLGTLQKLCASMKCKTFDWNSKRSGLRFASKRFVLMASTAFSLCWMSLLLFVLRKRFIFRYIRLPVRNSIVVALSANIFRFTYGQNFRERCSNSALQMQPISFSIRLVRLSM